MVFYLSLSDFVNAFCLVFGGTRSGSVECYLQGLFNNYFGIASFFWSAAICYQVYLVVYYGCVQKNFRIIAAVCWTIPLIATFTPLSTSTYGNDDGTPGWCFLNAKDNQPNWLISFWFIFGFYFWLGSIMCFLTFVVGSVIYKLYIAQRGLATDANKIVRRILPYPCIVIVCWIVTSVVDLGITFGLNSPFDAESAFNIIFSYVLPTSQGTFSALVYFILNHDLTSDLRSAKEIEEQMRLNGEKHDGEDDGYDEDEESGVYGTEEDDSSTAIGSNAGGTKEGTFVSHGKNSSKSRHAIKGDSDVDSINDNEAGIIKVIDDHHETLGAVQDFNADYYGSSGGSVSSSSGHTFLGSSLSSSYSAFFNGSGRGTTMSSATSGSTGGAVPIPGGADIELQTRNTLDTVRDTNASMSGPSFGRQTGSVRFAPGGEEYGMQEGSMSSLGDASIRSGSLRETGQGGGSSSSIGGGGRSFMTTTSASMIGAGLETITEEDEESRSRQQSAALEDASRQGGGGGGTGNPMHMILQLQLEAAAAEARERVEQEQMQQRPSQLYMHSASSSSAIAAMVSRPPASGSGRRGSANMSGSRRSSLKKPSGSGKSTGGSSSSGTASGNQTPSNGRQSQFSARSSWKAGSDRGSIMRESLMWVDVDDGSSRGGYFW